MAHFGMDRGIEAACKGWYVTQFNRACVKADKIFDAMQAGTATLAEWVVAVHAANEAGKEIGKCYIK